LAFGTIALSLLAMTGRASASPITVVGGFTSFTGVTSGTGPGCDPILQASIAGAIVNAPVCTEPHGLWGPSSVTFSAPLQTVEFFEIVAGTVANPNALSFVPATGQTVANTGDEFLLGSFSYTNGTWFGLGTESSFHFQLTTVSDNPAFNGHVLSDDVVLNITPTAAGNTPDQNADFVYLSAFTSLGSIRAYESFDSPSGSNVVTVDLYGKIGSLIPTEYLNVRGGGFVDPSVTADPSPTAVPEPTSIVLVLSGLAGAIRRRRQQNARVS
jgi:hypothetical protein